MATIVRVKRRRADEPVENIVVSCKRRKNDAEDSNLQSSLKFAGTAKSRDDVSKHIRDAIRKEKLQKEYKQHHVDLSDKTRQNHRQQVKAARFKVTSSFRAIALDNLDLTQDENETDIENKENQEPATSEDGAAGSSVVLNKPGNSASENQTSSSVFQLYDVEDASGTRALPTYESLIQQSQSSSGITCNSVPLVQERVAQPSPDEEYVYDLYFTNNRDFSFKLLESALTIEAFGSDFVHDYVPHQEEEEVYEDEDDSNDEDNWRNDYPDEDPHFVDNQLDSDYFYNGDVIERQAFGDAGDAGLAEWMHTRCNIEDADELSSGEEDSAYFAEPLNPASNSYQNYYRKVRREMDDGESHSHPNDDDIDDDDEND